MMCITEYDEARAFREQLQEGIEIGEKRGERREALSTLRDLVKDGILTLADAAQRANMTVDEFQKKTGLDAKER